MAAVYRSEANSHSLALSSHQLVPRDPSRVVSLGAETVAPTLIILLAVLIFFF